MYMLSQRSQPVKVKAQPGMPGLQAAPSPTSTSRTTPIVVAELVEDEPIINLTANYPVYEPGSAPIASMAASNSRTARTNSPTKSTATTTYSLPGSSPAKAPIASMADSNSRTARTKPPTTTTKATTYSVPGPTEMVTRVQTYLGRNPKGFQCPYCHCQSVARVRERVDHLTLMIVLISLCVGCR